MTDDSQYQPASIPEPWSPATPGDAEQSVGRPSRPRRRRRRRRTIVAGAAVLLWLATVGTVFAVRVLSGGGAQPEEAIPGDAFAFVKIDLDPSAQQKIAAFRFLRGFPDLGDGLEGQDDLRRALFDGAGALEDDLAAVDYERDVEPWLGKRVGAAALPPGDGDREPQYVVALQVTDAEAAEASLGRLAETVGGGVGFAMSGDYVLVSDDEKTARDAADAAAAESLADSPRFDADVDALGDRGVALAWMDMDRLSDELVASAPAEARESTAEILEESRVAGRVAYTARFDARFVEVVGHTIDAVPYTGKDPMPNRIGELPETTAAAVSVTNSGAWVQEAWKQLEPALEAEDGAEIVEMLDWLRSDYGLVVPDDLVTLFGEQVAVALDGGAGLVGDHPLLGVVAANDADRASAVLERLEALSLDARGEPLPLQGGWRDGTMVAATDPDYAVDLAPRGERLGLDPDFRTALPDAGDSDMAVWLDVGQLMDAWGHEIDDPELRATFDAIGAVGMTSTIGADGDDTFRLRVVAD